MTGPGNIVALSGGVGGAKLVAGLAATIDPRRLFVVCNTADDFEHWGLHISPDIDSVMYALAGLNDEERGWGRRDETWNCMETMRELGGEAWFQLGDRDLAIHLRRSHALARASSLTEATRELCEGLAITSEVLPMSDDPVRTIVATVDEGELEFQRYFVERRCAPAVTGFRFAGIERATPQPRLISLLDQADCLAVVFCPSNPFVSLDPILRLPGVEERLTAPGAPLRIAISPIIGGRAVKGPAAKMMQELGMPSTALEVARYYHQRRLIDIFVLDEEDRPLDDAVEELGVRCIVAPTRMTGPAQRENLARLVLELAAS